MILCIGNISKIDKDKGTADIAVPERNGVILTDVPFVNVDAAGYPDPGETVVALFEGTAGRYGRGYILGKPTQ
jgi:hypothetical protein